MADIEVLRRGMALCDDLYDILKRCEEGPCPRWSMTYEERMAAESWVDALYDAFADWLAVVEQDLLERLVSR